MPFAVALSLLLDLICVVHAIRTGRPYYWIFVILGFPVAGGLAYFFFEMLPDMRNTRAGRQAARKVMNTVNPQWRLKELAKNLRISDNVENKVSLADECLEFGMMEEAIDLYRNSLNGIYKTDAKIMLKLATAQFKQGEYAAAKTTLDELIAANPDFKSQDGHLLFARCLENLQQTDAALQEYATLAGYYAGPEAKYRYALLLQKTGQTEKASRLFGEIVQYAKDAPAYYRQTHREWITQARQQLGA